METVTGACLEGVEARLVACEVDLALGLPTIQAVGLLSASVREGLDRIKAAVRHAGFAVPQRRIVVNLAPAEVRKHGAALDLAIAAALLAADRRFAPGALDDAVVCGELGLDGAVRPVRGALPIALAARAAGRRRVIVPEPDAEQAGLVEGIDVLAVASLDDLVAIARGATRFGPVQTDAAAVLESRRERRSGGPDLDEIHGHAMARRALEVAAAGAHHLILIGPPGTGKTMLARRLPGILPSLSVDEALEVTRVWSAAGLAVDGLVVERPFRAPHHGVTMAGLIGGGARPRAGEVSLASGGVLFLDELPEFRREALEALRQPLEDGEVVVRRADGATRFPARFSLVAALNPCPCGHHGDPEGRCRCTGAEVRRYLDRLSGPLLDRFDLAVDVPRLEAGEMTSAPGREASVVVRGRVERARARQWSRSGVAGFEVNARLDPRSLDRVAPLDDASRAALEAACRTSRLSPRGVHRVRRVARTIADLRDGDTVVASDVIEALALRAAVDRDRLE